MADDDTTDAGSGKGGVSVPAWLAAALVVVLGIAIGGVGYAIGSSDSSSADEIEQIANVQPGEGGPQEGDGGPLARRGPGGPGGPGGFERRGGEACERGERGEHERGEGEENEQGEDDSEDGDQSEQAPDPLDPLGPSDQGI
jgi:hypothetical protein